MGAVKKMQARYTGFKRDIGQIRMDDIGLNDPSVRISCGEPDPRIWYFRADGKWYTLNLAEYFDDAVFPELAELIRKDTIAAAK